MLFLEHPTVVATVAWRERVRKSRMGEKSVDWARKTSYSMQVNARKSCATSCAVCAEGFGRRPISRLRQALQLLTNQHHCLAASNAEAGIRGALDWMRGRAAESQRATIVRNRVQCCQSHSPSQPQAELPCQACCGLTLHSSPPRPEEGQSQGYCVSLPRRLGDVVAVIGAKVGQEVVPK